MDRAVQHMRELQTSQDFKSIKSALEDYEGASDPQCSRTWNQLNQWKDALISAAHEEIRQMTANPVDAQDADVGALDAALETYEAYGDSSLASSLATLRARRNALDGATAEVVLQLEQLATDQSNDCAAIDVLLTKHRDAASPQVRAARQSLAQHRAELVNGARAALVEAAVTAASSSPAGGTRALAAALQTHAGCATALPNEFAEAQAQLRALVDGALEELSAAARSADYRHVCEVLERAREFPAECTAARQQLESHARSLVQAARSALLMARSSSDMATIDESLAGASAFGEELVAEVEATAAWRARLLTARGLISASLRSTDLAQIDQVLAQCAELGPAMVEETRALREHQEHVSVQIRTAVDEISALLGCDDLQRVTNALMAYADQPASAIRAACAALEKKQQTLVDSLLAHARQMSADESSQLEEVEAVAEQLEAAMYLGATSSTEGGSGASLQEVSRLLRARCQLLLERRGEEIRRIAASDDLGILSRAATQYSPELLPSSLRTEAVLLQQRLAVVLANAREQLVAACEFEDLRDMDTALQQFRDLEGEVLSAEVGALLDARERLLQTAAADAEALVGSTDVVALGALYWRLEGWPGLEDARAACYQRWDALVGEGRQALVELAQHGLETADLAAIDRALMTCGEWGEGLLDEELRQLEEHRAELIGILRAEMSAALAGDDVVAVCEAAAEFGSSSGRWGNSISAERELAGLQVALGQHAEALQHRAHQALGNAARAGDVWALDAFVAPYRGGSSLRSLFPEEVVFVLSQRSAMLRQAAAEMTQVAQQSTDPALIAAQLQQAQDMPPDRDVDAARLQLNERLASLLAPHRAEVAAHCNSREIHALDASLAEHDIALASGDAVAVLLREEWEAVRERRALLVDEARETLRALAASSTSFPGGGQGSYAAVASALSMYASYAGALPAELARCRSTLSSLLLEMKQALAAATAGDDVGTMDSLLAEVEREGFGAAVAAEAAALRRRREAVLARTLREVEALQHSSDLSAISAVLDAADDSDSGGVQQVDVLRERARLLAASRGGSNLSLATTTSTTIGRGGAGGLELSWRS
jgi:hypothetical protein